MNISRVILSQPNAYTCNAEANKHGVSKLVRMPMHDSFEPSFTGSTIRSVLRKDTEKSLIDFKDKYGTPDLASQL